MEASFGLALFIFTFVIANFASIFICLYVAYNRKYNIPMILIMSYGCIGTLMMLLVGFLLYITSNIEESNLWKKFAKMREF